jgi:amidase
MTIGYITKATNMNNLKEITAFSAIQLAEMITTRQVSCEEVMMAYLDQIHRLNPSVNAIISLLPDDLLIKHAKEKDQQFHQVQNKGFLYGMPLAPKDLTATKGIATTLGSPILKNQTNAADSINVERMRAAGGVLIGKTNVPEFGLGSHTYNTVFGTTLNSYDQTKTAGGSSGGTSVALALHMLPIADGSDFGGSLRNPAGWNNVYGLRPTLGRVPTGPSAENFYDQLPTEGPMARTVSDLAMMLSIQAGHDPRAPLSLKESPQIFTQSLATEMKGKKIGWMGNFAGYLPMEAGVLEQSEKALQYFTQMGCVVEQVVPQFEMSQLWQSWLVLRAFVTGGKLMPLYQNPEHRAMLKPEAIWEIEQSLNLKASDVYTASVTRSAWTKELRRLFQEYDVLVLPSAQVFAFDAQITWPKSIAGKTMDTYHRWMEVVIGGTLASLPVLAVPAGFHEGVPFGLQLIGKPQGEFELLQVGYAWEQATPFKHQQPNFLK